MGKTAPTWLRAMGSFGIEFAECPLPLLIPITETLPGILGWIVPPRAHPRL